MPDPFVVTPDELPPALPVVGEEIRILAPGGRTGSYEIFFQAGPEGSGPPPHNHPWDESFYVMDGEVAFGYGEKEMNAVPGTLVHLPAGTTHWFRFGKGGGKMLSMTSREAASHMFSEFAQEIAPDKPDVAKLVEIGAKHGAAIQIPKH